MYERFSKVVRQSVIGFYRKCELLRSRNMFILNSLY